MCVGGWRPPSGPLPGKCWGGERPLVPPCSYAYDKQTHISDLRIHTEMYTCKLKAQPTFTQKKPIDLVRGKSLFCTVKV